MVCFCYSDIANSYNYFIYDRPTPNITAVCFVFVDTYVDIPSNELLCQELIACFIYYFFSLSHFTDEFDAGIAFLLFCDPDCLGKI